MGRPFTVAIHGEHVVLRDADDPREVISGRYDARRGWLELDVSGLGVLHFTQRTSADEPGFTPRTSPATRLR